MTACGIGGLCVAAAAAGGGHLSMLQWLRANKCPWVCRAYEYTCGAEGGHFFIIYGGHIFIIKWLSFECRNFQ
jgi:hypothetical protein